jgi:C4-dicarboxylate-specific signal transduction histidine kinase
VQLKFTISDTGIGLSAEQINKLFQPFPVDVAVVAPISEF